MKFSTSVALFALLASNVAAAPAIKTVYVTQYTTVLKKIAAAPATVKTETPLAEVSATTLTTQTTSSTEEPAVEQSSATSVETQQPETTTSVEAEQPETTASTTSTSTTSTSSTSTSSTSTEAPASTGAEEGDHAGQGTYYDTGLGACGITNVDTDFIVAVSKDLFDENLTDGNPNDNPLCGKKIRAFYEGKSVDVAVEDRCVGCSYNDLDFSPAAFESIADKALGRIEITWEWL